MSQLAVGDTAPDFRTTDTAGNPIHLDTLLKNGSVILAFYPRAFTPG
jgi:peroxiredoxin Q/BCP